MRPANEKLSTAWCSDVVNYYVYNSRLENLLRRKDINEIEGYANGDYDLSPFKRMFRSLRKQQAHQNDPNIPAEAKAQMDTTGIQWDRVPLIPPKLNSAVATAQKIPIEISCICQDPLAQKRKKKDLDFLRNLQSMKEVVQPLYDSMNLGEVDMGATEYSSIPYTHLPLDLDVNDEEEFLIFANLIYNLAPEAAFEVVLQQFYEMKKVSQIKLLEIRDQYKFGISCHRALMDKMTGLPNVEYVYPSTVYTNVSLLPDFSDNIIRVIDNWVTPMELFKYFPNEICDEEFLAKIINFQGGRGDAFNGYTTCNDIPRQEKGNWNTFKMNLRYVEVKSVDSIMVAKKPKSDFMYFTDDEKKCTDKIWAQNTYCFYWLWNTKYFFGIDRLPFAHRAEGDEIYSGFSTNIYKSQEKSAVELCIGENKKAQMADIKLQHAIIMSSPAGKVIDMKYVRAAVEGLSDDLDKYTTKDLIDQAMERNVHIIDTEGFEGKQNSSQFLPVRDLPGGLKDDIVGYYRVILEANQKISLYTGINEQLTGQSSNPEGLVGLQKLLLNASANSLYYVNEAVVSQYQSLFNIWASYIQQAIKKGGKAKAALINMIGTRKVDVIKGLDDAPLHQIGTKITLGQREEERAAFKMEVQLMRREGKIDAAAEYYILNCPNPKDAMFLTAMFERRFQKRQDARVAAQNEASQQLAQQQGQNTMQNTQVQTQGKLQQIQAEGEVDAQLMKLGNQLGMSDKQIEGLIKRALQKERNDGQIEKSLKTIYAQKNLTAQETI